MQRNCSVDGCDQEHDAKGFCSVHYRRFKRHGDPLAVARNTFKDGQQLIDRTSGGCWMWLGRVGTDGYGRFGHDPAHRRIYQLFCGPIPSGLQLDHLCRTRLCVNPDHLEPVTASENLKRSHRDAPQARWATRRANQDAREVRA